MSEQTTTQKAQAPSRTIRDAVERYELAAAEAIRFDEEEHSPALAACVSAVAGVPHVTTQRGFVNANGKLTHLSTDSPVVATARSVLRSPPVHHDPDDWLAVLRELVTAADGRDAQVANVRDQFNIGELRHREIALGEAEYVALVAVIEAPAHDLADVLFKLGFIAEKDVAGEEWALEAIAADVRRFVVEGRAA